MAQLKKLLAMLSILVCATTVPAKSQVNAGYVLFPDEEGSPFQAGDMLAPDGQGNVTLYHDGEAIASIHDPEGIVDFSLDVTAPLYVVDAEGNRVQGSDLRENTKDLFLSRVAPGVVFYKKEFLKTSTSTRATTVDMTWHGGTILVANKTMAIFWGNWSNPGDIITGIDSFFQGWGDSGIAAASDEYSGSNGQVTAASTYLGHVIDTSTPPSGALTEVGAVAEVCKMTNNNPDPAAVYFIYTSTGAGNVNYCAWHSWGSCLNGAPLQVAYMPNITGISGCDPSDSGNGHSEGLSALANVTSHELSEAITDPRGAGWYDSSNGENGDKCAWSFHNTVTLNNGSNWKLQMEWSNAAYDSGTGYPNRSGQPGCLQSGASSTVAVR
jgi:hypothetical protein